MSSKKPSIPSGTRDFGPVQVRRRRWIIDTIRGVFERYGYQPIETPAMENLSVLEGKYGEEGDRLLFRILNQGDAFNANLLTPITNRILDDFNKKQASDSSYKWNDLLDIPGWYDDLIHILEIRVESNNPNSDLIIKGLLNQVILEAWFKGKAEGYRELFQGLRTGELEGSDSKKLHFTERGLRYDLTVPFARYVVMHQHELTLPFRRYQMQPVWRGDRPQRGRYREFWQCDADVVGSTALIHEAEFIQIYDRALSALGLQRFTIRVNHRQVLGGLAALIGAADRFTDLTVALDKLDKVGRDGVRQEFVARGLAGEQADALFAILDALEGRPLAEQVSELRARFSQALPADHPALQGVADLAQVFELALQHGRVPAERVALDLTLARGLSYYTGCIFEVVTHEVQMGSIGGGGRYDNLTAAFGAKEALPGAGISFGLDRLYDVIEALERFPADAAASTQVLVVHFAELGSAGFERVSWLRDQGLAAELYPEPKKLGKQFEYADKRGIRWAWAEGPDDRAAGLVQLKDLSTGTQQALSPEAALAQVQQG